jgi:hypothetical protein
MNSNTSAGLNRFRPALTLLEGRENPASGFVAAGAAAGGEPLVQVTRQDGSVLAQFEAFDTAFRGGVRVATGNLDGNPNVVDVVAVPGPGGGPLVRVFAVDTTTGAVSLETTFLAFDADFRDGLRVAVGQIDASGVGGINVNTPDQIVIGADAGGGPRVSVFGLQNGTGVQIPGPLGNFFAFDPDFRGGVRVAAGTVDTNTSDGDELIVGAGPGGGPQVRVFGSSGAQLQSFFAFPAGSTGGVNVSYTNGTGQILTDSSLLDFSQRNTSLNSASGSTAQTSLGTSTGLQNTSGLLVGPTTDSTFGLQSSNSLTPGLSNSATPFGFQNTAPLQTNSFGNTTTGFASTAPLQTTAFGNTSTGFQSSSIFGSLTNTNTLDQSGSTGNSMTF